MSRARGTAKTWRARKSRRGGKEEGGKRRGKKEEGKKRGGESNGEKNEAKRSKTEQTDAFVLSYPRQHQRFHLDIFFLSNLLIQMDTNDQWSMDPNILLNLIILLVHRTDPQGMRPSQKKKEKNHTTLVSTAICTSTGHTKYTANTKRTDKYNNK